MGTPPQAIPTEVYAIFTGMIDEPALARIVDALTTASANKVQTVHLALQTNGGGIGEGVALYNLFRALPNELVIYNVGLVASIGVIAYLGAKRRKTSAHARFMIHRTQTNTQWANTQTVKAFAESAVLSDKTTEAILRKHIDMPENKWTHFDHYDLYLSADEAVKFGIANEIGEFSPPPGTQLYNL